NGVISGGFNLTKIGSDLLTLGGANTYTGLTNVSNGTLRITNGSALGATANGTTVASGAALDVRNGITSAQPLKLQGTGIGGGGALVNSAGTNTLSGDIVLLADTTVVLTTNGLTLSGAISGAGGLTVRGSTLTLAGSTPNTYAGPTILPNGTIGSPGGF